MTAPSTTENTVYVDAAELAARWKVSVKTARRTTQMPGFPAPLELGPRSRRWPEQEVEKWEQGERRAALRRVVTGKRPQHHAAVIAPLTVTKTRVRTVQAA